MYIVLSLLVCLGGLLIYTLVPTDRIKASSIGMWCFIVGLLAFLLTWHGQPFFPHT
jgi:hypothetical protein